MDALQDALTQGMLLLAALPVALVALAVLSDEFLSGLLSWRQLLRQLLLAPVWVVAAACLTGAAIWVGGAIGSLI